MMVSGRGSGSHAVGQRGVIDTLHALIRDELEECPGNPIAPDLRGALPRKPGHPRAGVERLRAVPGPMEGHGGGRGS